MKHGTPNHPKLLNLMSTLSLRTFNAVGVLETLWLICVDEHPIEVMRKLSEGK